jgi:hypothetical protein
MAENDDVKGKIVELGAIRGCVNRVSTGDIEMKRSASYFLANITEQNEFHRELEKEFAFQAIIELAVCEDIECQEYAAFSLAHLASNKDNQVKLVDMGVVRPLVAMLSMDAEPKHYAGLALLKLADNFENHLKIAEEGGIQALLRLGRTRTTDVQMQHKAAITLGQLASNAVRLIPTDRPSSAGSGKDGKVGTGSKVLNRLRNQVNAEKNKGRDLTIDYLDKSLAKTQHEKYLQQQGDSEVSDEMKTTANVMSNTQNAQAGKKGFVTPSQTGNLGEQPTPSTEVRGFQGQSTNRQRRTVDLNSTDQL